MLPDELVFDIAQVTFCYRGQEALSGLSLQVKRGERIALIGANGSGKSTLLRLLAGLSFPDSGSISLFGEELTEKRLEEDEYFFRFRRRVGILFQNPDVQLFNASVFEEVAFGPLQMGWPQDQIRRLVLKTLEEMRIAELQDRAPHRLSGGEKKRVALASVLVLDTLEDIADRCYVLDNGRIAAEGAPLTILHDTRMLAAAKLVRPQHHTHSHGVTKPHPHVHTSDIG
jgi:cobalt/nickel transport system ATP-binding protein